MKSIALGSVVFSRSGRDAGRFYVVIEIVDDEYVTIADGRGRVCAEGEATYFTLPGEKARQMGFSGCHTEDDGPQQE